MQKQGTPFLGGGAVVARAAEEFNFAVEFFDEARGTEPGQSFAVFPEEPTQGI